MGNYTKKPKRCIDPIIKYCEGCKWGYSEWVEATEELEWGNVKVGCTLGYDQGRPEDEPTEEELKGFEEYIKTLPL